MSEERVFLEHGEAKAMMAEGDYVHTFRNACDGTLIGADMGRDRLIKIIEGGATCELAGEVAADMKHGLVIHDDDGFLFVATKGSSEQ